MFLTIDKFITCIDLNKWISIMVLKGMSLRTNCFYETLYFKLLKVRDAERATPVKEERKEAGVGSHFKS